MTHAVSSVRKTLVAIGLIICSMAFFSGMNVMIRYVSEDLPTPQIVFLRNLFSLMILLPWVLRHGSQVLQTQRMKSHFWRATVGIIGMQTWFYCVSVLPLNEATALSFTSPIFTFLFAIVFLGERPGPYRIGAMVIGFVGAMVIIRPNPNQLEPMMFLVLFATSMWAIAGMLVKSLTTTERPTRIVFYMAFFMTLWSLPLALMMWHEVTLYHALIVFGIALASTGAHLTLVQAYSRADIVTLMPFDFFRMVFTAIFAYIFFHEVADIWTWIGGAIIVGSAVAIARREAMRKRMME